MLLMSIDSTVIAGGGPGAPIRQIRATVVRGVDSGRSACASDVLSIGTAEGNALMLTDTTVSRFHVDLERAGDRILIHDHRSTNGVIVNQTRVDRGAVLPGTILELGRSQVRVDDGETVEVETHDQERLGEILGSAPVIRQLMARVRRAAASDASVLLQGETGSGKEVVARTLHQLSRRADEPFEVVDCGSIQPTLIGSELFGHEKGAFTGADRLHEGAFERAQGGTIFLDEVGELPLGLQAALLGALERRSFRRLGGKTPIDLDARIICATHRELREEVNTGGFRQDLLYRIAVVTIRIPALRERQEDIPRLIEHFARQAGYAGPLEDVFPPEMQQAFDQYRWPGNVRELRNAVEAALVMGEHPILDSVAAPEDVGTGSPPAGAYVLNMEPLLGLEFAQARARFETEYLKAMVARCEGNVAAAARKAKVNRSYLFRMLKRYDITVERSVRGT